jgi:hypothetical protein
LLDKSTLNNEPSFGEKHNKTYKRQKTKMKNINMVLHTQCLIRVKIEFNYNFFAKGLKILLTYIEVNFGTHVGDVFV